MCHLIDAGECEPLSPADCEGCDYNPDNDDPCRKAGDCAVCDHYDGSGCCYSMEAADDEPVIHHYNDPDAIAERRQMGLTC